MTEYNPANIETKWQAFWEKEKTFKTDRIPSKKKFYCLDFFPYPSGAGLHIGHPLGYTATDIYSRYKRMNGFSVLHPMGFDAFGLPAEQHAINTGEHPGELTEKNCERFVFQMKKIGLSYDWDRQIASCRPDYYRWTQWIFLKLYNSWFDEKEQKAKAIETLPIPENIKRGTAQQIEEYRAQYRLAYYADAMVNWCPALGTVLSNEEVIDGKSERGGHEVVRKPMKQWMLRITAYAERLLNELEEIDWPESIKEQQRNWIGRSEGVNIKQRIKDLDIEVEVYDSIPQTFIAHTFCVIAAEHPLVNEMIAGTQYETQVKEFVAQLLRKKLEKRFGSEDDITGIFTGRYIKDPFGKGDLPIWVASYVVFDYGTGIVNCSAHDERDFAFAKKYGIPLRVVLLPPDSAESEKVKNLEYCYLAPDGIIQEPAECKGMDWLSARTPIINLMEKKGWAKRRVNYRLRDWLFSRQRYWGEPIPIIHWEDGTISALEEKDLPLLLPDLRDYKPTDTGESPLAKAVSWLNVSDPKTGRRGRRETNIMPQWAGSCWYYLRFIDPQNDQQPWDRDLEKKWMPVDLYVGGAEHAVLHLLYARFWHKVLYDLGFVSTKEPFKKLFNQGMIVAFAYRDSRGSIVSADQVDEKAVGEFVHNITGEKLERITRKMSKSLKNVIDPLDIISQYGADTLRMYLMFMGPLDAMRPWDSKAIQGSSRFLKRAWNFAMKNIGAAEKKESPEIARILHSTIKRVTDDIENLRMNTAISTLMEFVNAANDQAVSRSTLKNFILLLSPFAPHLSEELWQQLGNKNTLSYEPWPKFDEKLLISQVASVVIQINGKKRGLIEVPADIKDPELKMKVIEAMGATQYTVSSKDNFITVRNPQNQAPKLVNVVSTTV
jgi:leucyl-tRNA synthetase